MSIAQSREPAAGGTPNWAGLLSAYQRPSTGRSLVEIAVTALPFFALWAAAWLAFYLGYWWATVFFSIPAGVFLVRLFMIQHDCGHGAFFARRWMNDWAGRIIGVLTLTPYDYWRRTHAVHHATAGNLDRRGMGDIDTLTVREYAAMGRWGRLKYRLYRHPLVMFGLGPAYVFLLQQRLPFGLMRASGWGPWISTQATNAAIALIAAGVIWLLGAKVFFLVQLPIIVIAGTIGVWLFYVQHQFEDTLWAGNKEWKFQDAALQGSSYYDLPALLRWLTANIGIHHVHHLASRIPYYRLQQVLRDYPALRALKRVTIGASLRCVQLTLWDEDKQRLVSFREARRSNKAR